MAETVNSGSVEPDQANTCEGNKRRYLTEFLIGYPIIRSLLSFGNRSLL